MTRKLKFLLIGVLGMAVFCAAGCNAQSTDNYAAILNSNEVYTASDPRDTLQCTNQPHLAWCRAECRADPTKPWCPGQAIDVVPDVRNRA